MTICELNLLENWRSNGTRSPASLAHRYALSIPKVGSVILGVKNRAELKECIEAERRGDLSAEQLDSPKKFILISEKFSNMLNVSF